MPLSGLVLSSKRKKEYDNVYGGEIHVYKSSVSSSKRPKKGSRTHIYINPASGEVFEETESKKNINFGFLFAVIGVPELSLMMSLTITVEIGQISKEGPIELSVPGFFILRRVLTGNTKADGQNPSAGTPCENRTHN